MPGKTFRGWSLVSDRAGVTLPCDGVFTGHVWITIWAQSLSESSRDPTDHRHFSWSTAVGPFMPAGLVPGTAPPSGRTCTVHPQALCTATYTHDLARAGVIGACSHAGPGGRHNLSPHSCPQIVVNFPRVTHMSAVAVVCPPTHCRSAAARRQVAAAQRRHRGRKQRPASRIQTCALSGRHARWTAPDDAVFTAVRRYCTV